EGLTMPIDSDVDHDVIIVGFGPAGSTLAGLLAKRGLDVLVIDRDTDIYPLPRAVHFDHEIMRVVQELGIADALAADTIVNPGMDFLTAERDVLLSIRSGSVTSSGWPASVFFFQPDLEIRLRDRAIELGARVRLGVAVDEVIGHDDHVEVLLADGSRVTAAYMVGCDGARSTVRRGLGIEMDDLNFEEPWLVVDLLLRDDTPPPSNLCYQVCDPARPTTLVPMPPPRFRFEFMLIDGDDAARITEPGSFRPLLEPWMNPDGADIERAAVYTFHGLIARQWREGRILLAGDAAHMTPPFLGQGMCAGTRDVANLAWKLDRVLRSASPDALLDTYQTEREPNVRLIIQLAVDFGRLICTTDRAVAMQRDTDMLAARAAATHDVEPMGMPPLTPGPLILDGGGTQAIQPRVLGERLDDLVGSEFAVVSRHPQVGDAAEWWRDRGAHVLDANSMPEVAEVLDRLDADVAVVRPDRYVLTSGATLTVPSPDTARLLTP
ncbi:MAG: bifunctional 3-(3-hydroxy-phenyl)propionate/3-hydroxycinnamic acid hydroxylase, partial [Actinomycetota bacterium]